MTGCSLLVSAKPYRTTPEAGAGRYLDEEKAAYRFAGAFLMPAEALWSEVGKQRKSISLGELLALKSLFGVSVQALTYRCRDLGIFGPSLFQRLYMMFSRLGWRSPPYEDPDALAPEQPRRFERLCLRALAEDMISESRASELPEVTLRELEALMEAPSLGQSRP